MPSWKKVIVSGSQAHLSGITSSVLTNDNLLIAGNVGQIENSGLTYNGTTLAIGGANITSIGNSSILTGSFSGSFAGTFTGNLNSVILANDNNGRQYSTNGGTTASLNTITFRDTDTTSDVTQSIGRIAFESSDTDTSGSNNSQLVRAFIEAVSEDTSPDTFLAFGTAVSGALAQERMRINSSGRVGIGTGTPTNTLQVAGSGIATTNLTASGNISSSAGLIGQTLSTSGNGTIGGTLGVTGLLSANGAITTTNITASGGGYLLTNSNNGRQYSTNGGASTSLNTLTFRDTDTTSDVTQSIGRIAFESFDTDTSGSNNSQVVRAFIEAVSEDTSPDAFLAFGTAVSGALAQERMRINSLGNVGIGTGTPTNTLQVAGSGIATTNLTASGDLAVNGGDITTNQTTFNLLAGATGTLTIGAAATTTTLPGNLIVSGSTTLGDASGDSVTINAATIGIANIPAGTSDSVLITDGSKTMKTRTIDNRVWGSTLIDGSLNANRVPFASDGNTITDDSNFTYNSTTDVLTVNGSTFGQDVVVSGNLTVNGDTTILNVANVLVEDRFILLASGSISGSATHADGGIIVQYTTGSGGSPTGSALFLNSKVDVTLGTGQSNQTFSARWGLNNSVGHTQTTLNPTDYLVSVTRSQAVPTAAPEFGGQLLGFGNMYIQNNGDIWFWSPDLADEEGNIVYAG
jgi:hypothetical protein